MIPTGDLSVLPGPGSQSGGAIVSGFFSRAGGRSEGHYAGLNCGFGSSDRQEHVAANRTRVAQWLGVPATHLLTPHQVHSADSTVVFAPWARGNAPQLDSLVTTEKGIAIAVLAADCAPVLMADAEAGVVGAAHAGWRGALDGVIDACVSTMETSGAERSRIEAMVGPCISQNAYEVGHEFEAKFLSENGEYAAFFDRNPQSGRPHFDLSGFVDYRLRATGVSQITCDDRCTYDNESLFYSYRRSQHRQEPDYGRQISAIVLK